MIYFLSDAHLGSRALGDVYEHQRKVIQLLNSFKADATHIYLLGDMFDFWFEYFSKDKEKKKYSALFQCIRHLVKRGIKVHYFLGNHDMWTFGGLHKLTGVQVHDKPYKVSHNGKRLYMAHGDGLIPQAMMDAIDGKNKELAAQIGRKNIRRIRRFMALRNFFHAEWARFLFKCLPPYLGNALGLEWAKRSRLKEMKNPCPFKGEDKEELVLFAKEREQLAITDPDEYRHHDYYIFGHRHIALDLPISDNSRVIVLGDCFKQWTYAKLDENGELTLCTAELNN